jgi:hypothetical protein
MKAKTLKIVFDGLEHDTQRIVIIEHQLTACGVGLPD